MICTAIRTTPGLTSVSSVQAQRQRLWGLSSAVYSVNCRTLRRYTFSVSLAGIFGQTSRLHWALKRDFKEGKKMSSSLVIKVF